MKTGSSQSPNDVDGALNYLFISRSLRSSRVRFNHNHAKQLNLYKTQRDRETGKNIPNCPNRSALVYTNELLDYKSATSFSPSP